MAAELQVSHSGVISQAKPQLGYPMTAVVTTTRDTARPRVSELGLNQLGWFLVLLNGAVLVTDVALFAVLGLSLKWTTVALGAVPLAALFGVWLNFYLVPGGRRERLVAELVFIVGLMVLLTNLGSTMQYGSIAIGSAYVDSWLAAADAAMGVHVPSLAAWTSTHPFVNLLLRLSYASLMPQLFFAVIVLAAGRDRARLWEFAFHFHVCLVITVAALTIFPAVCPPAYYHFQPTIDMTRVIRQIQELHDGTMKIVRFDELEGLVSIPSFHVAGGFIVAWALRDRRWLLVPIVVLNVGLVASTFMSGVHYLVDVVASAPLFAFSVFAYARWASKWLPAAAVE